MPHGNHHPFPQGSLTGFCRGSSTGCRAAETSGTISQGLSSTKKSKAASLAQHLHPWMLMEEIPHLGCINWMYKIMSYSWTGAGCLPWRRSMEFKSAFGVPFAQGIYAWYFRYKHICRLSLVPFSSQSVGPRSNYTAPCWGFSYISWGARLLLAVASAVYPHPDTERCTDSGATPAVDLELKRRVKGVMEVISVSSVMFRGCWLLLRDKTLPA